jgi:molecular chaperone GrpE (heat shock protein)
MADPREPHDRHGPEPGGTDAPNTRHSVAAEPDAAGPDASRPDAAATSGNESPERNGGQGLPRTESGPSADELVELLRQERADFLNYRRRMTEERAADRARARAEAIERLLPLIDELDLALAQVPDELDQHPWARGVAMTHRRLLEALEGLGVERIGVPGELFDPERHEALFYTPRPGEAERRVAAVIRAGYQLGGRLLRPAQVSVVGPPQAAEEHRHSSADEEAGSDEQAVAARRSGQHQAGG